MASALREQLLHSHYNELDFMEQLGLLVDRKEMVRHNIRLKPRPRRAILQQGACIEELGYQCCRDLDERIMLSLASCDWIRRHQNVVVPGATGVGKTCVACALDTTDKPSATTAFPHCSKIWLWVSAMDDSSRRCTNSPEPMC